MEETHDWTICGITDFRNFDHRACTGTIVEQRLFQGTENDDILYDRRFDTECGIFA